MASLSKVAQELFEKLIASGKTEREALQELERRGLAASSNLLLPEGRNVIEMPGTAVIGGVKTDASNIEAPAKIMSTRGQPEPEPKTLQQAINLNTDEFQRPTDINSGIFNRELDVSNQAFDSYQQSHRFRPGVESVSSPIETPTSTTSAPSPITLMDQLRNNKGKVGLGVAGAGLAGAAMLSGPNAPTVPSEPVTVTETEPGVAPPMARTGATSKVTSREVPDRMFKAPGNIESLMKRLEGERAKPIDGKFAADVESAELSKQGAEGLRDAARERNDMGQLFDILGRSLVQIGAAQQGMRSGADMSGIAQKSAFDWEGRRKEITQDYDRRIAEADKKIGQATRGMDKAEAKAESAALERRKILTEDYFDKWKAYRDEVLQSQRLATTLATKTEKEAAADLKSVQQKLGKEEARQTARRQLDVQIDTLKAAQGTSNWDKELARTKELFAKLNTDVEAGDRAFAPALPSGFWENLTGGASMPDVDAIKKYNRGQIQLGDTLVKQYQSMLGSGQVTGEIPAAQPQTQTVQNGMVTVQLANGQQGQIPAANLDAFLRSNPGSKQVR